MLEKIPESVGQWLQNRHAGIDDTVFYRLDNPRLPRIDVRSSAFSSDGFIPIQYTADGLGLSPPLQWSGVPPETSSIVLIVEDADSPTPHPLVHAIVVNLGIDDAGVAEGAINNTEREGFALQVGRNSFLKQSWLPPDPPPGHGEHRYVFQIFAMHRSEAFSAAPGRNEIFSALKEGALAGGYLIGRYGRQRKADFDAARESVAKAEDPVKNAAVGVPV